jgi:hypothetical protein
MRANSRRFCLANPPFLADESTLVRLINRDLFSGAI